MAVAAELARRAHPTVMAGPARHGAVAASLGVDYRGLDDGLAYFFLEDEDVIAAQAPHASPVVLTRALHKLTGQLRWYLPRLLEQMTAVVGEGTDLVIQAYDELPFEQGHHLADLHDIPFVLATLSPNFVPSWHHPSKLLPPGGPIRLW